MYFQDLWVHSSPQLLYFVALCVSYSFISSRWLRGPCSVIHLLSFVFIFAASVCPVGDKFYEPSFLSLCPENVSCFFFIDRRNILVVHIPLKKHPCYSHVLSLIFSFNWVTSLLAITLQLNPWIIGYIRLCLFLKENIWSVLKFPAKNQHSTMYSVPTFQKRALWTFRDN